MKCQFNLENDVVVVTGAAKGLGAAIAAHCAELGATVIGLDISDTFAEDVTSQYTVEKVHLLKLDVTNEQSVQAMFEHIRATYGTITLLVNGVGVYPHAPLESLTLADWRFVMDVNLTSTYLCTRFFALGHPEGQAASIVNIASIGGVHPELTHSHYNAAKAGVIMFTRTSALSLAEKNIRVNAVSPGLLDTPSLHTAAPERVERFLKRAPLGFITTYEDITSAVMFLGSDGARSITGQTLTVDSGVTIAEVY